MIEDVVSFCSRLVKCQSVTPVDDGALELVGKYLEELGFDTRILSFTSADGKNSIKNLYARYGYGNSRILGFLGHSDVVPAGGSWEVGPFEATIKDEYLYGRGVCDMKGGIAAFCCALSQFIKKKTFDRSEYSMVVMITGDEEVGSPEGIRGLIKWCEEHGAMPQDCLIGEPSSCERIGDRVYVGHRGSLNVLAKFKGKQGHIAYQGSYTNSLRVICEYVACMLKYEWKHEDERFPRTNVEPTLLFTNNYATNVAPDESSVNINVRYSADYKQKDIEQIFLDEAEQRGILLEFKGSGDAYCCDSSRLRNPLCSAIQEVVGHSVVPEFSCAGGTSDGRYMVQHCDVIEFGLRDDCIHQKNERAKISDLLSLSGIYYTFLEHYFEK